MINSIVDTNKKFFELVEKIRYIDSECLEEPIEPYLEILLEYIIDHPELKTEFINAFIQIIHDPDLESPELVEYCMHALRWEEVKHHISDWLESENSERIRYFLKNLLMSFDDDWYDATSYIRFANELNNSKN